ncbi:DUF3794 domain-containing protein [Metallumcola ferriviriculae]|uniref:DUF3794 domain-containing protein n=1 Tax=Metallumcola ferriviriculae TaxID=3039180 RepID=A0AAU0UN91_9FIRM|nr:DUF3794 domain-containing protein [Desulfitibacteraceae bacterium MK1]
MNCLESKVCCEIKEICPKDHNDIAYYTQTIVNRELSIPEHKPPKEKILSKNYQICITKTKPIYIKLGCGKVTGCKLLVAGSISVGVEYSAAVPEQNVHYVHYDLPFHGLIMDEDCGRPIPKQDCDLNKFDLFVCTEHFQLDQINPRQLRLVVVLMLWLKRKHHCEC